MEVKGPLFTLTLCVFLFLAYKVNDVSSQCDGSNTNGIECPITQQDGIVSINPIKSCSSLSDPSFNCENSRGTATVMELAVKPGQSFTYNFLALVPDAQYQQIPPDQQGKQLGCLYSTAVPDNQKECLIPRPLTMRVTVSKPPIGYNLRQTSIIFPYAYTCHTSKAVQYRDQLCHGECKGFNTVINPNAASSKQQAFQMTINNNYGECYSSDTTSEDTKGCLVDAPSVGAAGIEQDGSVGVFNSCTGTHAESCDQRDDYCSLCSPFAKSYRYFQSTVKPPDTNTPPPSDEEFTDCPFDEYRSTFCTDVVSRECTCPPNDQDAECRRYCGSACNDKMNQFLNTRSPCMQYSGVAATVEPVDKCIDNGGDIGDDDNTGIDQDCIKQCQNPSSPCNIWDECFDANSPPLYDDCGDDFGYTRASGANGPKVMFTVNRLIPGYGFFGPDGTLGLPPNGGGKWPSNTPPNIRPTPKTAECDPADPKGPDDSYCSVNDDDCCTTGGFDADTVYIAQCPAAGCLVPNKDWLLQTNEIHGSKYRPNAQDVCPDGTNVQDCNWPYERFDTITNGKGDLMKDLLKNPFDYSPFPMGFCPDGPKSRQPIVAMTQNPLTGGATGTYVAYFDSGEAIGSLGPTCNLVIPESKGVSYVDISVEIFYDDDPVNSKQTMVLSNFAQGNSNGQTAISQDGTVFAKFLGLVSTGGAQAPYMEGAFAFCNMSSDYNQGVAKFNMGGNRKSSDPEYYKNFLNPWPEILKNSTVLNMMNPSVSVSNKDLPGLLPLPQILKGLVGIPPYSWWYYISQQRLLRDYGNEPGKIGMPVDIYKNKAYAQKACDLPPCSLVPGFERGEDAKVWDLPQRLYDSDVKDPDNNYYMNKASGNQGLYEQYMIRKKIVEWMPGVISTLMHYCLKLVDFLSFITELNALGIVPPGFIPNELNDETGKAAAPTGFIQEGRYFIDRDSALAGQVAAEQQAKMSLTIANSIYLDASTTIAPGKLVINNATQSCLVGQNSASGTLHIRVVDTSKTLPGNYQVIAQCTDNIVPTSAPITGPIPAGGNKDVVIKLSHTGNLPRNSSGQVDFRSTGCFLTLVNPNAPFLQPLSNATVSCVIAASSNNANAIPPIGGDSNFCQETGACSNHHVPPPKSSFADYILTVIGFATALILAILVGMFLYRRSEQQNKESYSASYREKMARDNLNEAQDELEELQRKLEEPRVI